MAGKKPKKIMYILRLFDSNQKFRILKSLLLFFLISCSVVKSRVGERGCKLVDLKTEIKVQDIGTYIVNNSHEGLIFSTFYPEIFASFGL